MAQFARPDSTVSAGGWDSAPTAAQPLWQQVDEAIANDATDYIQESGVNNACELGLSDVVDPLSSSDHVLRIRAQESSAEATIKFALFQGGTQIAISSEIALTAAWTDYSITLTLGEANAITNYADLRVKLISNATTGTKDARVTWVEFEVPNAPPPSADFVGSATGQASSANLTVNVPAGTQDGDLMVAVIMANPGSRTINVLSGWTAVPANDLNSGGANDYLRLRTLFRIAQNEPASYTFTFSSVPTRALGAIVTYRKHTGVDENAIQADSTSGSTLDAPAVTPRYETDTLLACYASRAPGGEATTWVPAAGMIELVDFQHSAQTSFAMMIAEEVMGTPGVSTGTKTGAASVNVEGVASQISIHKSRSRWGAILL